MRRDKIIVQKLPQFYYVYEYDCGDFLRDGFVEIQSVFFRDGEYYNRTQGIAWVEYNGMAFSENKSPDEVRKHYKHDVASFLRRDFPLREQEFQMLYTLVRKGVIKRKRDPELWKLFIFESHQRELRKQRLEMKLDHFKFMKRLREENPQTEC